jgi:hypothetical protein
VCEYEQDVRELTQRSVKLGFSGLVNLMPQENNEGSFSLTTFYTSRGLEEIGRKHVWGLDRSHSANRPLWFNLFRFQRKIKQNKTDSPKLNHIKQA